MTLSDFKDWVLLELGVLAAGETADSEDTTAVTTAYTAALARLEARGHSYWNVDDAVPDEIARQMIVITASELSRQYGKHPQQVLLLKEEARQAEDDIASIARLQDSRSTQYTDF